MVIQKKDSGIMHPAPGHTTQQALDVLLEYLRDANKKFSDVDAENGGR